MQQLKRIGWHIGQALLPEHFIAQEESLLAHMHFHTQNQAFPCYGIGELTWDDALLRQGIISISKLTVIFPSGEIIDIPENGKIASFDLNKEDKNEVSLYLHLRRDLSKQEVLLEGVSEEKLLFSMHQLELSQEGHLFSTKTSLKLAEFKKDAENRWSWEKTYTPSLEETYTLGCGKLDASGKNSTVFSDRFPVGSDPHFSRTSGALMPENELELSETSQSGSSRPTYIPPLFSIKGNPFFKKKLERITSEVWRFQTELEQGSTTEKFKQKTLETKLCLMEIAKLRRLLMNIDRGVMAHPFFLYETLSQFLDTVGRISANQIDPEIVPYQHELLGHLFHKLEDCLTRCLRSQAATLHVLSFEKKDNAYISDRLPQKLAEASELYFIIQPVDPEAKASLGGLKLASHSRLANVCRFALTGIPLLQLDSAPFNNNFSPFASIYKLEKDVEWQYAMSESRAAFTVHNLDEKLQAFLYWKEKQKE